MRKVFLTAALVAVALPLSPAMARQMAGYTVRPTEIVSGPDNNYPTVRFLDSGVRVAVYGCLSDWSWCDVSYNYDRGWVAGGDIVVDYQGHRSRIVPNMGVGILAFVFGAYWDEHYRGRQFYSDRARWQQSYTRNYRPEWGGRAPGPSGARPGGYQRQGGQIHQGQIQGQAAPHVQANPTRHPAPAIRTTPNATWGAAPQRQAGQHQGGQRQGHVAPMTRAAPVRQAAPAQHGAQHGGGQQPHGGQQARPQGGAPQGHPQGHNDAGRKPHQ